MSSLRDTTGLWYACTLSWVCEKYHKKIKKIIWRKIVAIHSVFKKKTTGLNS